MKNSSVKNIAFGFGVTVAFFIIIELILLAAGVKTLYQRTDPAVGFAGYAPLFVKITQPNGEEIYSTAPNKMEWFNMQRFPAKKAENVTRIFCIGGSTTYGRPYDDLTSFCGWLRQSVTPKPASGIPDGFNLSGHMFNLSFRTSADHS